MNELDATQAVREFLAESERLNGQKLSEREPWRTEVTADAIRHVAYGISDDNPLWLDAEHARTSRFGSRVAPPAYLCSVLYPVLHGAPLPVPLSNLIIELEFEWHEPVLEGDLVRGAARQLEATESRDRHGRPLALILSETDYWNQRAELVARAKATLARAPLLDEPLAQREVHRYGEEELRAIGEAQRSESRRGGRDLFGVDLSVGDTLPPIVRGPLTIGDMICWQAAIGPSYRPGSIGYRDALNSPYSTVIHPVTGWPVKHSHQHEDALLSSQRGMPLPFDNGVMRLAWITPLLTNWMGDNGWLERLTIRLLAPNLYGDTTWYRGAVADITEIADGFRVEIEITGVNQLGETTTVGEAMVRLPSVRRSQSEGDKRGLGAATETSFTHSSTVYELFTRQVENAPDAPAVVFRGESLSYDELNSKATALASRLVDAGLQPDSPVGICLPRSSDWIVAIFAVLKAGGTFVPLDPTYPRSRLEMMVGQVQPQIILVTEESEPHLPGTLAAHLLMVENEAEVPSDEIQQAPTAPGDRAYIVFTSGTTGPPNGVAVSQTTLGAYVEVLREALAVKLDDVYLHTATFSFSASMRQVFVPLCAGATVVITDDSERLDPLSLVQLMKDRGVTIWDTVPSVFRNAIETLLEIGTPEGGASLPSSLRLVALTGEALDWDLPASWRRSIDHPARLVNLYSHSETAGTISMYPIPEDCDLDQGGVPLGWPVAGSVLYILGPNQRPVPRGEVGELWVGGARLSDGYVGNTELTDKRFVKDPFRGEGLMYRTGDLGRLRSDGAVEFVGRVDARLNIRGHRIEPAEIERALREHPGVSQALVTGKVDQQGELRLVAYVVPSPAASPTVEGQPRYELPNDLALVHINRHETDFIYQAIYEDQTYLKHGITFADGDCIFDVGANIGQFSLFAHMMSAGSRIYAFEPNPQAHAALVANLRLYGVNARVFPFGLSDVEGQGRFTAFEGFSLLSGLYADVDEEKKLVRDYMDHQGDRDPDETAELEGQLEEVLDQYFVSNDLEIPLRTLSSVIEEEKVDRINLLKINIEKSEWDALRGIHPEHWPLIQQMVIKVDLVDKLEDIVSLLESYGMDCVVDQDETMTGSRVHTVYAIRPSPTRRLISGQTDGEHIRELPRVEDHRISAHGLREFLTARLPAHLTPSAYVLRESLPVNLSGKLDRASLPEPDWTHPDLEEPYTHPTSPIEKELGAIWCDVLGVARVGRHDHFLDLGGDSIKAVRIINKVRHQFHAPLPLTALFRAPTIAELAKEILASQSAEA